MTYTSVVLCNVAGNYADNATKPYVLGSDSAQVNRSGVDVQITDGSGNGTTTTASSYGTQAGSNNLICGRISFGSAGKGAKITLPGGPGVYRLKMALFVTSATTTSLDVRDGPGGASLHSLGTTTINANAPLDILGNSYANGAAWWSAPDQNGNGNGGHYIEVTSTTGTVYITKNGALAAATVSAFLFEKLDTTAPTITSTSTPTVVENTALAHNLTADETVTWSIVGGADQAQFELSGSVLRFLSDGTKDFESPTDADANNVYVVQVRATDLTGNVTNQTVSVTVTNVDDIAPTITSSATLTVAENATLSHSLTANETVTWSIVGGADQAQFELSGSTLRWVSDGTQDFESPTDADVNNVYLVQVRATDTTGNVTNQTITVTATDVAEGGGTLQDVTIEEFTTYGALRTESHVIDTIYAGQPQYEPFGVIKAVTGAAAAANFSIVGGNLASYFAVKDFGGGKVGLEHTSTRIPDNVSPRTLTIRQTDGASTHNTTITFANIVNSPSRPTTGEYGDMPTQMWNFRKMVRDMVMNNVWTGLGGRTPDVVIPVSSPAQYATALNNLNPDPTMVYAIEFQPGTWSGGFTDIKPLNFTTGGILHTRAAGSDPEINMYGRFKGMRNIDLGDLRYPGRHTDTTGQNKNQFIFLDPNVNSTTVYHRICDSRARVGWLHSDAAKVDLNAAMQQVVAEAAYFFNSFMFIYHAESLYSNGTDYRGSQNHSKIYNTRYVYRRCHVTAPNEDIGALAQIFDEGSKKGIFADDHCYMVYEPVVHDGLDYSGLNSLAHSDIHQPRPFNSGATSPRFPGAGFNGSSTSLYNTSNRSDIISQYNGTMWKVINPGTTGKCGGSPASPAVPPEMSTPGWNGAPGTQIQDGDLLLQYKGIAPGWGCKQYIVTQNAAIHSASYVNNSLPASIQFFINSAQGLGWPFEILAENCLEASPNSRGIDSPAYLAASIGGQNFVVGPELPRSKVYAWRFAAFGPASSNKRVDAIKMWSSALGVDVMTRKSILPIVDSVSNYSSKNEFDNLFINYKISGNNPGASVRGGAGKFNYVSKVINGQTIAYYEWPSFLDKNMSRDQFVSEFSKILHHNSGAYGPRLREEHTVTVTDAVGKTATFKIIIDPPSTEM